MKLENLKLIEVNLEEVRKIRKKVLYISQSNDFLIYDADKISTTKHFGLIESGKLRSIMTLIENKLNFKPEFKSVQIRGMATLEKFQRKGYGSILLNKVINFINYQNNFDFMWCNARKSIIRFYTNNNFTPIGDDFNIDDIGIHKLLYRKI